MTEVVEFLVDDTITRDVTLLALLWFHVAIFTYVVGDDELLNGRSRRRLVTLSALLGLLAICPVCTGLILDGWPTTPMDFERTFFRLSPSREFFEKATPTLYGFLVSLLVALSEIRLAVLKHGSQIDGKVIDVPDKRVTAIANDVAQKMGLSEPEIRIWKRPDGNCSYAVAFCPFVPSALISERIVDVFTDHELQHIIAHELQHYANATVLVTAGAITLAAVGAVSVSPFVPVAVVPVYFTAKLGLTRIASHLCERNCDSVATRVAGRRTSASSLRKLYADQWRVDIARSRAHRILEAISTHPSLEERLVRALGEEAPVTTRQTARERSFSTVIACGVWCVILIAIVSLAMAGLEVVSWVIAGAALSVPHVTFHFAKRLYRRDWEAIQRHLNPYRYPKFVASVPLVLVGLIWWLSPNSIERFFAGDERMIVALALSVFALSVIQKRFRRLHTAANTLFVNGDPECALALLSEMRCRSGERAYAEMIRIQANVQQGELSQALKLSETACRDYPSVPFFWISLADLQGQLGRFDNNLAVADTIARLCPMSYYGPVYTAIALLRLERPNEAESALDLVYERCPHVHQLLLAEKYIHSGDISNAKEAVEACEWNAPETIDALRIRAMFEVKSNHWEAARLVLSKLAERLEFVLNSGTEGDVLRLIARTEQRSGHKIPLGERLTKLADEVLPDRNVAH